MLKVCIKLARSISRWFIRWFIQFVLTNVDVDQTASVGYCQITNARHDHDGRDDVVEWQLGADL